MAQATPEPILLSGPQVAKRLGISYASFKRLVARKIFTQIRIPRTRPRYSWAVVQEELSQYILLSSIQEPNHV